MKCLRIATIVFAMILIAHSSSRADWQFYGSARISSFIEDSDIPNTTQYDQDLQSNSRIGARIKVSDELFGRFEYGASSNGDANIRLLYGEWDFITGKLLVGQTYPPIYMTTSKQVYGNDKALKGWGDLYGGRSPQIKLTLGNFQLALLKPSEKYLKDDTPKAMDGTDVESKIPAIQAAYRLKKKDYFIRFATAYNSFEVDSRDVNAHVIIASVGANWKGFSIKLNGFNGTNVGNMGILDVKGGGKSDNTGSGYGKYDSTTGKVIDVDALGYTALINYAFNDKLSVEGGLGYAHMDTYEDEDEDDVISYYLQIPIIISPGVFIIPEMGKIDFQQNQGKKNYYGAKWQINF